MDAGGIDRVGGKEHKTLSLYFVLGTLLTLRWP